LEAVLKNEKAKKIQRMKVRKKNRASRPERERGGNSEHPNLKLKGGSSSEKKGLSAALRVEKENVGRIIGASKIGRKGNEPREKARKPSKLSTNRGDC